MTQTLLLSRKHDPTKTLEMKSQEETHDLGNRVAVLTPTQIYAHNRKVEIPN